MDFLLVTENRVKSELILDLIESYDVQWNIYWKWNKYSLLQTEKLKIYSLKYYFALKFDNKICSERVRFRKPLSIKVSDVCAVLPAGPVIHRRRFSSRSSRTARFAQGGNAIFEGRVRGNPKPTVSWTHKGAPLLESWKIRMSYDDKTGAVTLQINQIGPGDEGEYTCSAKNQYGKKPLK